MITVTAELVYFEGNRRPYFSITAAVTSTNSRRRRDSEACGCLHDDILHYWPQLAPVVALHLSDDQGQPTHAIENGWYWLAGYYGDTGDQYTGANSTPTRTPAECLTIFARHARLSLPDAHALAFRLATVSGLQGRKAAFVEWIAAQAPRWQEEANAGIALLDSFSSATALKQES